MGVRLCLIILALAMLTPAKGFAQGAEGAGAGYESVSERPHMQAVRVDEAPTLDGEVINDGAYGASVPVTELWQTTPDFGAAASERTDIRVVYTDRALYIGVTCFDRNPEAIIVSDSRRDAGLNETDSFILILDTYLDGQNGFLFGTNPAGIEFDAQVSNEGQGGFGARQQSGSGGGFNINWDGSWDVRTTVHDQGWSAEFEIPFRTLRFPRAKTQVWGLNFQRNVRRRNERAYWTRLPRQYRITRVSRAGRLEGLEVPQARNLQVMPYLLGQGARQPGPKEGYKSEYTGDLGADLKYSITPALTLDVTYNTDFAQVEVDEQQINLDRFNLFFPEKRPFFLENAGLFSVGVSEFSGQEVELFFSRRIGIGPRGEPIPILGGARLSGQLSGINVGLLNMQTQRVDGVWPLPAENFSVARVRKDFPGRSSLGAMVTNRLSTTDKVTKVVDREGQTVAMDGRLGLGPYTQVSGFFARTYRPGVETAGYAYNGNASYVDSEWRLNATFTQVGEDFHPAMGFLQRGVAYRKLTSLVLYAWRPEDLFGLLELRPHVSYQSYWDLEGFQQTARWHIDNHFEWNDGFEIHTGINFTREGVKRPFLIAPDVLVEPDTYDHAEAQLVLITNQGKKVSLSLRSYLGGFFGGSRTNLSGSLRVRANEAFTTEVVFSYNDIRLLGGDFKTHLVQARISYSFTPRIFVQSLVQYNDIADLWSANLRFGWLQTANTGLFVVFNEVSDVTQQFGFDQSLSRSITVKYSRLINVLR